MRSKRFAALHLAVTAAAVLFFAFSAAAQDTRARDSGARDSGTTGSAPREIPSTVPQAPIGHRQPRLSDIPPESRDAATRKERSEQDRALDKALEICRGC